jgi:hypothetical protein
VILCLKLVTIKNKEVERYNIKLSKKSRPKAQKQNSKPFRFGRWSLIFWVWFSTAAIVFTGFNTGFYLIVFTVTPSDATLSSNVVPVIISFLSANVFYLGYLWLIRGDLWKSNLTFEMFRFLVFRIKASFLLLQILAFVGNAVVIFLWFLYPDNPRFEPLVALFVGYTAVFIYLQNRLYNAILDYPNSEGQPE